MSQLSQMIDDARARARILERAIQKVLDTPAAGMTAEQFKNRITGGLNDALHGQPVTLVRIVEADWRDEAEGYIR